MPRGKGRKWRYAHNQREYNTTFSHNHNESVWGNAPNTGNVDAPPPPPGLRGKALGLYYRDRQRGKRKEEKERRERLINLKIPRAIEAKTIANLKSIAKIAEKHNITITVPKLPEIIKEPVLDVSMTDENPQFDSGWSDDVEIDKPPKYIKEPSKSDQELFKKPNSPTLMRTPQPSSSSAPDFIPLRNEITDLTPLRQQNPDFIPLKKENFDFIPFKKEKFDNTSALNFVPIKQNLEFIPIKNEKFVDTPAQNFVQIKQENLEFIPFKNEKFDDTFAQNVDPIKQENLEFTQIKKKKCDDTSTPDFIPVKSESLDTYDYGSGDRVLSLRSQSEYKYSYEDIITGTFDEKLDECLSKGVSINLRTSEIEDINECLYLEYQDMQQREGFKKMMKFRETLPTYKKGNKILDEINKNQVVVISGETGCGKSTQVPQLILDSYISAKRGGNIKILVTQPRRIAASSLAQRVAKERGEQMGNSVGYAVRLEKVDARPRGSITFCTTGILLADLEVNQGLTNYSHIILDEVHERDSHIDLSMCMIKKVLAKRQDLKLILMSATIDAEKLSEYFDNCPMLHIEGLAYPVQDIYLEDIIQMTKYKLPEDQKNWKPKMREMRSKKYLTSMEKNYIYRAEMGPWVETLRGKMDPDTIQTLLDARIEDLNVNLICELLFHICRGPPGAILVFLPGIGEITKLINIMDDSGEFPNPFFAVYPLHSKLPTLEQHKIFERPPLGTRKIIIATNIAETSITIDDIVYVVDCGKLKMSGLNVQENISTLKVEWISQANMRQRRGRAGRCQPGICYHLVTSHRASKLDERLLPELQRSNLLEPVLTLKRLRLGIAAEAFKAVPAPPDESTVRWAVKHLQQCGALDDKETLTPLGWHMARLPVHPAAGKLILLGALFGCLDRAASVAAVWGFKDPFQLVIGKEEEVDLVKRNFAIGEPSDHVAISEAIIAWERCPEHQKHHFAFRHFLSNSTLQLLSDMKRQLGDSLKNMGFLSSGDLNSRWENRNANNLSLFKALIAAALYPNIGTVSWTNLNQSKRPKQMRIRVTTPEDSRGVNVHPSSVMSAPQRPRGGPVPLCHNPGHNWLVYWLKQRSSDLFLFEVTLVYTLPLLFFGELNISVNKVQEENECYMSISTVKVKCDRQTANLLLELRSLLDKVLAAKVMTSSHHGVRHSEFEESVLNAVIRLITAEDEQVEYLRDDQSESDLSESDTPSGHHRPY